QSKRRLALPGQPPFLFQNVSVAAELKPYTSCLLRDSAARKGWVISYRAPTDFEFCAVPVGAGSPAKGPALALHLSNPYPVWL
ncbi:hypothetical protein PV774_26040, partial [Pseudomonas sp. LP23]